LNLGQWIGLIAIVLSLYILWQIRDVLLLMFAAMVISTTLNRLAKMFQRKGMKRGLAVLLSVGIFFAVIIGFFWIVVPPFITQFHELTYRVPKGLQVFSTLLEKLKAGVPVQLAPYIPDIDSLIKQAQPFINKAVGNSLALLTGSLEAVLKILLVLVLTGMFLSDPQAYRKLFIRLFPSFYRRRVDGILDQCEVSLEGWVSGAAIAMLYVGTTSMVGLLVLRVPSALALAVLSGFMNLIPNLGPTISLIPALAIALLDAPWKAAAVFALYFLIQQTEGNFITPMIMAHQVSLLPAITLIAQLFFLTFFGPLGLLLSLPLTVVTKIWTQEVLIKDVLDEWGNKSERETEFIMLHDDYSEKSAIKVEKIVTENHTPNDDEPQVEDTQNSDN
jgi:predicted PurR-regulated permease PerM